MQIDLPNQADIIAERDEMVIDRLYAGVHDYKVLQEVSGKLEVDKLRMIRGVGDPCMNY